MYNTYLWTDIVFVGAGDEFSQETIEFGAFYVSVT